jgi:hypothetical protein
VVHHQGPVRAPSHVKFDPIGPHGHRLGKGVHGIFGNALVKTTVGKDLSHLTTLPQTSGEQGDFRDSSIIFPDQGVLEKILIYPLKLEHPRRSLVIPLPEH